MILKPLFARVLLERQKADKVGSIFVPAEAAKRHATLRCRVLACGPEADSSIQPDMEVIIGLHTGTWINADGRPIASPDTAEYFIVQDEDILCVVGESDDGRAAAAPRRVARAG